MAKILKLQRSVKYFSGHFVSLPLEKRNKFKTTIQFRFTIKVPQIGVRKKAYT